LFAGTVTPPIVEKHLDPHLIGETLDRIFCHRFQTIISSRISCWWQLSSSQCVLPNDDDKFIHQRLLGRNHRNFDVSGRAAGWSKRSFCRLELARRSISCTGRLILDQGAVVHFEISANSTARAATCRACRSPSAPTSSGCDQNSPWTSVDGQIPLHGA